MEYSRTVTPAPSDLIAARDEIASGRVPSAEWLARSDAASRGPAMAHAFIRRFDGVAKVAAFVDGQHGAGAALPPLAGLAVSVKDLFDVAGLAGVPWCGLMPTPE